MGSQQAEIRELIKWFEAHGWKVIPPAGNGYPMVRCPCGKHQRTIHKTPSNARYALDTKKWAQRAPCWDKAGGGKSWPSH